MRRPKTPVRTWSALFGAAVMAVALLPGAAVAQETDRFTCQATLIRIEDNAILGTVALGEANTENDGDPCQTEDASLIGEIAVGPVTADLLFSRTDDETDEGAKQGRAEAGVAEVAIDLGAVGGPVITVEVLTAEAQAGPCPSTALSSESEVVSLQVDDEEVLDVPETFTGDEHFELEIPGIGTLHLNEEDNPDANTIRRRALFFEDQTGVVGDIIIAEAIADVHGNPCEPDEPEERLPGWMTGGGFVAEPGSNRDHNNEGTVEPGTVLQHAFSLECFVTEGTDPKPGRDNLVAQWFDEVGNEHSSFKLTELEDTRCYDSGGDPSPPPSAFDTIEGSGVGICRSQGMEVQVHVDFLFTDAGEPGRQDFAFIDTDLIEGVETPDQLALICDYESEGLLDGGNHQAHQTPAQRTASGGDGTTTKGRGKASRF